MGKVIRSPIQQAFLLQQRLTEVNHPDHTLITYPSPLWKTESGAIPEYVLADLYSWLEAHSGISHPYVVAFSTIGANSSSSSR